MEKHKKIFSTTLTLPTIEPKSKSLDYSCRYFNGYFLKITEERVINIRGCSLLMDQYALSICNNNLYKNTHRNNL